MFLTNSQTSKACQGLRTTSYSKDQEVEILKGSSGTEGENLPATAMEERTVRSAEASTISLWMPGNAFQPPLGTLGHSGGFLSSESVVYKILFRED